ncbi:Serine/threonine-protein kinase Rio1 [Daldinia decipiens]|uniref:Serine/threonine-protein kinase Rio1 n=1 Tax=Daldinia decipiens TaxID=326647 RepID=UPI0020C3FE9F|nr:Serine/threonine-protein kinase Rio1 [Daldinia decipiens]KAI1661665.1 Serine/threonine-protein kinase Rio1 [Daldinia decipiens]
METENSTTIPPSQSTHLPSTNSHDEIANREVPRNLADADAALEISDDDDDLDSVFSDYDDIDDGLGPDGEPDMTRNFNRQQPLHSNQQKPAANTAASVDDQITALSRHAAKIRLDDVKEGQDREKDKADRATSEQVLDQRTRMILYQMINRGVVNEIYGAISTGKEANVYGAIAYPDINGPPVQRAVKVYKTAILSFKDRERYITGEHRFKSGSNKGNSRKMVQLWAEKEYRNLQRIHSAAIPCPEPLQLKLHVLLMSFLGDKKGYAYPRLRDANIPRDDADQLWRKLYVQLLGIMRRMYQVTRLVHADLSEYNILYNDEQLYIIDVSQSVEHDHPRSLEFLRMDIKNTGDFFRRQGVDTLSDRTIFDFITESKGAMEEPRLSEVIEELYASRSQPGNDEAAAAELEVDNEVFRNQYIPQTLEQVYDIEKDAQKIGEGEGDKLVYKNLLADQVVTKPREANQNSEDESDEGAALDSDDDDDDDDDNDESRFEKGTPRGKRFEDKDEKKQRKQAAKEAKAEKRKEKMPKHLKKRLVAATSRKNR